MVDADCENPNHWCQDGECVIPPYDEEGPFDECFDHVECGAYGVCEELYGMKCVFIEPAPDCASPLDEQPLALAIPDAAIALSFADVDEDGDEELVVASETQLLVFESGVDTPTTSARELGPASVDAISAGPLDDNPGEDLVVLVGSELRTHVSDGFGGFTLGGVSPEPRPGTTGLRVGDFDGQAPADVLVWGDNGADVMLAGGASVVVTMGDAAISGANVRRGPGGRRRGRGARNR